MRILIIGGTQFVGRAIAESAIAKGHEVTLFHRGQTNADLLKDEANHVLGDRFEDLGECADTEWDAVIDTCAYYPRACRIALEALGAKAKQWIFISTISVYSDFSQIGIDEDGDLIRREDMETEEVNADTYGGLKVLCEEEITKHRGTDWLSIRPGIIIGPHDPTDRFTFWACAPDAPTPVIVPERLDQPIQAIDTRDLGAWTIHMAELGQTGIYNAAGHGTKHDFATLLEACQVPADRHAAAPAALEEADVKLPLTLPADGSSDGVFRIDSGKAESAGLTFRPLEESARDTRAWAEGRELKTSLSVDQRRNLIDS